MAEPTNTWVKQAEAELADITMRQQAATRRLATEKRWAGAIALPITITVAVQPGMTYPQALERATADALTALREALRRLPADTFRDSPRVVPVKVVGDSA